GPVLARGGVAHRARGGGEADGPCGGEGSGGQSCPAGHAGVHGAPSRQDAPGRSLGGAADTPPTNLTSASASGKPHSRSVGGVSPADPAGAAGAVGPVTAAPGAARPAPGAPRRSPGRGAPGR